MMDPYIDGVVPIPMSQDEQDFLSGNLRRIHAAYDDAGFDLSALPEKAADEIKRMRELADSEGTRAVERGVERPDGGIIAGGSGSNAGFGV